MKNSRMLLVSFVAIATTLANHSVLNADIVKTYDYSIGTDGTMTTPFSGVAVDTFNNGTHDQAWSYFGNGAIVQGDQFNTNSQKIAAAPYMVSSGSDDPTHYYTIPENLSSGPLSVTVTFGNSDTYNYLGLLWGSMDDYNRIAFYSDSSLLLELSGLDVYPPADGNQDSANTNRYVNFLNVPEFNKVVLSSSNYAFELDNLAVGVVPVPVPGAAFLGMIGLGFSTWKLRKRGG